MTKYAASIFLLSWVPFGQLSCPLKICKGTACRLCFRKSNYYLAGT